MKEEIRTKYANLSQLAMWAWLIPALLLVLAVRLHGLSQASLADFDSVRNWQIVQEVAAGNLHDWFHHRSPGFYLFFAPLAALHPDFHWFLYLNALLSVVAVGWLTHFISTEASLRPFEAVLLALLLGTSTFLTFSGRDFALSSLSLVLYVGLLRSYYLRLQQPSRRQLLRAVTWVAVGLTVNYKFLLALPIIGLFELLRADKLLLQRGMLWRVLGILAAPYVVLSMIGWMSGLPWWRWLAMYYDIVFPTQPNAAGRTGHMHFDVLYYPRFLLDFESPLSWLGVGLFPVVFWREVRATWQRPSLALYVAVWAYCWLAGMSLLLKAPRGLLFAYGLFAVLGFLVLRRLGRGQSVVVAVLTVGAIGWNFIRIRAEVYAYTPTNYPAVATWLHAHGAHRVVSTVGLSLAPYLAPTDSIRAITTERVLPTFRQRGYRYVLLDGYWRVTNIRQFDSLRRQPPVAAWSEPMLVAPLNFLEHSEYTALSYTETLQLQRLAQRDTTQLLLYKLQE